MKINLLFEIICKKGCSFRISVEVAAGSKSTLVWPKWILYDNLWIFILFPNQTSNILNNIQDFIFAFETLGNPTKLNLPVDQPSIEPQYLITK